MHSAQAKDKENEGGEGHFPEREWLIVGERILRVSASRKWC
jgi:hypothetical protein